jgi:hypothetical protein
MLMVLSALYYSMLLTNWMNPAQFTDEKSKTSSGMLAYWLKIVAQWLTMLIFVFSIFAPAIFPGRF